MATAMRVASKQQQQGQLGQGWRANNGDKGSSSRNGNNVGDGIGTRLTGNKERKDKGGEGKCNGNEGGGRQRGQKKQGNSNGNKGGKQADGNCDNKGNDDKDEGGG
jgi:hypothetical protein